MSISSLASTVPQQARLLLDSGRGRLIWLRDDSKGGAVRWQAGCAQPSRGVSPTADCESTSPVQDKLLTASDTAKSVFPAVLEKRNSEAASASGCSSVSKS